MTLSRKHIVTITGLLAIAVIAGSIGVYIRLYPLRHFSKDESKERATLLVMSKLRAHVTQKIHQEYPEIPAAKKQILIKEFLNKLIHEESQQVRASIDQLAQNMDQDQVAGPSYPFLLASDSYYYYALTENIVNTGSISASIKGSKYFHPLMLAPYGFWEPLNLHPYIGYGVYQWMKHTKPQVPLMYAVSFTPLVVTLLCLIPFLGILQLWRISFPAKLTSAVFFILAPIFVKRSTFGWYDNDPYNILFPLLILWSLFWGLHSLHDRKKAALAAVLTMASFTFYIYFWQGWVFLFSVIACALVLITLYQHAAVKKDARISALPVYAAGIILGSFLAISAAFGKGEFFTLFNEGWTALQHFLAPKLALWPDLYISVSELRPASLSYIMTYTGGPVFLIIAGLGLIASLILNHKNHEHARVYQKIILAVFLVSALLITVSAQRFIMLCVIPLSLSFALGLHHAYTFVVSFLKRAYARAYVVPLAASVLLSVGMVSLTVLPIKRVTAMMPSLLNPIYNLTWDQAMRAIQERTPKDSIINTWWSPGHFIKAMGKRRVTFDGATINVPQAYWMANVLLEENEDKALSMLRMINNGVTRATEYITNKGLPLSYAVDLLKQVCVMDETKATITLKGVFKNDEDVAAIMNITHAPTPPAYLLLYNEFVEKNIQLPFFGNWDFKQVEQINKSPELLRSVPKKGSPAYIQFLWKIAGGPERFVGPLTQLNKTNQTVVFQENVRVHLDSKDCLIDSSAYGSGIPQSIFYADGDHVSERIFQGATLPYSVILFEDGGQWAVALLDRPLARSMLIQLFYFNGLGLKYIKPFDRQSDLTRQTQITLYEVDWKKYNRAKKFSF